MHARAQISHSKLSKRNEHILSTSCFPTHGHQPAEPRSLRTKTHAFDNERQAVAHSHFAQKCPCTVRGWAGIPMDTTAPLETSLTLLAHCERPHSFHKKLAYQTLVASLSINSVGTLRPCRHRANTVFNLCARYRRLLTASFELTFAVQY